MRVTIMGHAGLLIESGAACVLVDPVLRTTPLAGGAVEHTFARTFDLARMPAPTAVVVTHGHFDHFDPESLETLPRALPLLVPPDGSLIDRLRGMGFTRIVTLRTWDQHRVDGLTLTATPAGTEIDELGLLVESENGRFWHMSDAEATANDARALRARFGPVDLLSAKYQPTAAVIAQEFRCLGGNFDKAELVDWIEAACAAEPGMVFPYAAGVRFCDDAAWLNRFAFPFKQDEIVDLLAARLAPKGRVVGVHPGDVFEIVRRDVRHVPQGSSFVRHTPSMENEEPGWEPFHLEAWRSLEDPARVAELERRLDETMRGPMASWLAAQLDSGGGLMKNHVDHDVVWQVVVHVSPTQKLEYSLDFRSSRLSLKKEAHPRANLFTHIAGDKLLATLEGHYHPDLLFTLGHTRYHEKIIGVRDGRCVAPPFQGWKLFENLPDPLVYYLRRYASVES